MYQKDEIDDAMLDVVEKNEGACIRDIIRPFFKTRSESILRHRLEMMAIHNMIRLERTKREVRCYPVHVDETGKGDAL